ncbi:TonB-dependent receptor, partial [bacterium]|nr:TonB-dependent receptor [bacterium]
AWHYFIYTNKGMEGIPETNQRPSYWRSHQTYYTYDKDIRVKSTAKVDGTYYFDLGGEHMFKAGVQFNRIYEDVLEGAPYDLWLYYWGQNYEGVKVPRRDTEWGYMAAYDPYGTIAEINSDRWALYAQDSWTVSNKLTLNFGVRAEKENIPSYVDPDSELAQEKPHLLEPPISFGFMDKIAPRLGFAYDVMGDGSFKVFGSYGIYYDVMKLDMAEGSYGGFKWVAHYYEIPDAVAQDFNWLGEYDHAAGNPPSELEPYYIESLNWRIPSFETTQPDMEPYSKLEYTLGLQKRILEDMSFTAQFLHNHIIWAIEDIGVQTPAGEQYFNGNPGSEWVNEKYANSPTIPEGVECPRAKRSYYSVELGFDKRFSNNWMAGVHYTWSRLWGNFSGLASSDEHGRQDPNVERYFDMWFLHYTADGVGEDGELTESTGLLPTDRPHRFNFYGAYTFDFGMTLGFNGYAMTGTPVTTEVEINNCDGYYPEGRNNLGMRTPFIWKGDVYAEYNLQVSEGHTLQFNLNITNFTNNRIAQRIYNSALLSTIYVDNETIYNGFDWKQQVQKRGAYMDPRYKEGYRFQSPIAVRLGVKFIF